MTDIEEHFIERLAVRSTGETVNGHDAYSIEIAPDGAIMTEAERTVMARYRMIRANGHRCFCTTDDVPGMGRPCCVTGVLLPMSDRATFERDGGDMLMGVDWDEP